MHFLFFFSILIYRAQALAYDPSVLSNSKEAASHAFLGADLLKARARSGASAQSSFEALAAALIGFESDMSRSCGFEIYQRFLVELQKRNLKTDTASVVDGLMLWRSENWIDDVFYEGLSQIIYANDRLREFRASRARHQERRQLDRARSQGTYSIDDLNRSFGPLQALEGGARDCALLEFSRRQQPNRLLNLYAHESGVISDALLNELEGVRSLGIGEWRIHLGDYLKTLASVKNRNLPQNPSPRDLAPNDFSSSYRFKKSDLTYRKFLYSRFDSIQILMMSDLLKRTFDRMDASKAELVFTHPDRSETIPISPMGQYYFARKLLLKDMEDLRRSTFFEGLSFDYEDVVTAALETGLLNGGLLEGVFKIDDLWNPEVKPWEKLAKLGLKLTGSATVFVPPPYNLISSLALVVIEGWVSRKNHGAVQGDSTYDPF